MMKLNELEVYRIAMGIGDKVWEIVDNWNYFAKKTVGEQLVRAVDSIAANLSEGYGRFSYKENKNFCYYSRGSLMETKTWLIKAKSRKLIKNKEFDEFISTLEILHRKLNSYIRSIGIKSPLTPTNDQ
jgi:four helix bundle protein